MAYDMSPAPALEHQRVSGQCFAALFAALAEARRGTGGGECEVFSAPIDVHLGDHVVEPDLVVVCDPAKKSVRGIEGAARVEWGGLVPLMGGTLPVALG